MDLQGKLAVLMPECDIEARELFLNMAKNDILNFCNIEGVSPGLEDVLIKIALKYYNRWGKEGALSYSEGGQSQAFDDILTPDIKSSLYAYRKLRW